MPRGKEPPRIKRDAGRRDIRRPEIHGLLHAVLGGLVAVDRFPRILPPEANHRKAVVLSLVDDVDLVAAARSVFARPEFASSGMNGDTLDVAEAERVDFRMRPGAAGKRVVFWNRSIGVDAQHLAHVAVVLLRLGPVDGVG